MRIDRRQFLKNSGLLAGAAAGSRLFCAPAILAQASERRKLRVAILGSGGRGKIYLEPVAAEAQIVALVDVDEKRLYAASKTGPDLSAAKRFIDYRKMFDTMSNDIDAVMVATPNHHHALPSLMAMQLGKHVYCEKPLTHDIFEARRMAEFAAKYKVATQMGNQGHSHDAMRLLCEYIWAGAIGNVTAVYAWTNRGNGGVGPRPASEPIPDGLHWDEWIGPAPYREYHPDKIIQGKDGKPKSMGLHPHEWHNWHDFGSGSLGNIGCHTLDAAFWALKLGHPTSIEVEEMVGGSDERYPIGSRIRWDYPARGDMPPVKVYWFDGVKPGCSFEQAEDDAQGAVARRVQNFPPLAVELTKKYNRNLGVHGALYVGDKGVIWSDLYCGSMRILPEELQRSTPRPAQQIPRIRGTHIGDFLRACAGGPPASSNFSYSARLSEMTALGALACIAGPGKKVEWDGPAMKCTNRPELNRWVKCPVRKGWDI